MDQLSSCYFCGDALDASLSEYPVVPKQLHPDPADQQTVVLCQGCRQKLAPVVERVVESARDAGDPADGAPADRSTGGTDEATPSRSTERARVDGETIDVGDDAHGSNEAAADPSASSDRAAAAADRSDAASEASADAAGARADEAAERESASADDGGRAYASSQAAGGRPVNGDGTVGDGSAAQTESGGGAGDTGPAAGGGSGDPSGGDARTADADGSGERTTSTDDGANEEADGEDDAGPSMSALEYNKVIRLLQNRELPVDRAEFQTVALNAYDLEKAEFDAILDAAVERGLIAEENGKIVSAK